MSGGGYPTECEREPLHLTGQIQPHGALLILDVRGWITHVSENIGAFLPGEPMAWLDTLAPDCLRVLAASLPDCLGARATQACEFEGRVGHLDVVACRSPKGCVTLELTRPGVAGNDLPDCPRAGGDALDLQALVDTVAELTGFERILYYRFMDNGDGEVVAETRRGQVYGSYLGLRFPASDIPQIARHLYLCNPWRLIPDATARPVPILGRNFELPDLSWVDLRSVSPVHQEYLSNMGVAAALSFPVIVSGHLHALVACHHSSPGHLCKPVLKRISQPVEAHAQALSGELIRQRMRLMDSLGSRFGQARALVERQGDLASSWPELGPWLMQTFGADGAMLCTPLAVIGTGLMLTPQALAALDDCPALCGERNSWFSESLVHDVPGIPPSPVAGVLVVRANRGIPSEGSIVLTRKELIEEIQWGGNPHKPLERHSSTLSLSPRRSFEKWIEHRVGHARPWGKEATLMAFRLRELLLRAPRRDFG